MPVPNSTGVKRVVKKVVKKAASKRIDYERRWECPRCKAVHWYPFKNGCHRKGCRYKAELVEIPR